MTTRVARTVAAARPGEDGSLNDVERADGGDE